MIDFQIVGQVTDIQTIAKGPGVHDRARLRRQYGKGRWRKLKGIANVRLPDGTIRLAEFTLVRSPWYWKEGLQN